MSSFPILCLPHLALKDVIDCWNILESYQFSKVSKKCQEIAKYRFRTPPDSAVLQYGDSYYIRLKYRGTELHGDYYVECIQEGKHSFLPLYYYKDDPPEETEKLSIISNDPSTDMLKEMNSILEIFKCSLNLVTINTEELSIDQVKDIISWMNSMKQKSIPKINLSISIGRRLIIFLEYFKKQTEKVFICGHYNNYLTLEGNVEPLGFQCEKLHVYYNDWIRNKELFGMDFVKGRFDGPVDSVDVNKFLKNWKEQKSNLRMEECHFEMEEGFDLDTILDGLSPTYETEEGEVKNLFDSNWRHVLYESEEGDFDIERVDGTIGIIAFEQRSYTHEISIFVVKQ